MWFRLAIAHTLKTKDQRKIRNNNRARFCWAFWSRYSYAKNENENGNDSVSNSWWRFTGIMRFWMRWWGLAQQNHLSEISNCVGLGWLGLMPIAMSLIWLAPFSFQSRSLGFIYCGIVQAGSIFLTASKLILLDFHLPKYPVNLTTWRWGLPLNPMQYLTPTRCLSRYTIGSLVPHARVSSHMKNSCTGYEYMKRNCVRRFFCERATVCMVPRSSLTFSGSRTYFRDRSCVGPSVLWS